MNPNLIPSDRTKRLAELLIAEAKDETGVDAVLNHLDHIEDEQTHALLALVLERTSWRPPGRPKIDNRFSPAERRAAHAAYARGDRDPDVVAAEREYQRLYARRRKKNPGSLGTERPSGAPRETIEGSNQAAPKGAVTPTPGPCQTDRSPASA